jgi:hypothetical protein
MKRKPKPPVPPVHILSREFVYTPSHATDLRATFARARRKLAEQKPDADVLPIRQVSK